VCVVQKKKGGKIFRLSVSDVAFQDGWLLDILPTICQQWILDTTTAVEGNVLEAFPVISGITEIKSKPRITLTHQGHMLLKRGKNEMTRLYISFTCQNMSKYTNVKIIHIQYPDEIHRALAVRRQVFIQEQGYSEAIEVDG